jgi:acyl-CoA synthetase (AMP-forming)/AMP-acid ligase II
MSEPRLVHDLVLPWADDRPDDVAISFDGRDHTWARWCERVRRVAGALQAAGIRRGDRVALVDKNHPATVEVTLGAAMVGAAHAVVNWRLAADELAYVLADAGPRIVFVGAELLPAFEVVRHRLGTVDRVVVVGAEQGQGSQDEYEAWLAAAAPVDPDPEVQPDDPALVLYTSGTTGFPKGAMLSHRGLVAHTRAVGQQFPMADGDRNLVAMPLFHVGGSCYTLIGLAAGVPTTMLREVAGPALVKAVLDGATHAFLVPAVLAALVQAGPAALGPMAGLKVIGYGASPCPLPVLRATMAAWPETDFLQVYGMTELSGVVLTLSPQAHRDAARPDRLSSAGRPIAGVELRVVDPATGEDADPAAGGELWFRTEQRMAGYLGNPEATAQALTPDGWLRTGDVGRVDDGGFVSIVDRVKDMIITGGENVYGPEVERVLNEHPDVAESAVVGVPDEAWGEAVMAFVQPAPGATVDADELVAWSRERLAHYKCPRSVETVEALPRNATGKVLKTQLRRPYWEGTGRAI